MAEKPMTDEQFTKWQGWAKNAPDLFFDGENDAAVVLVAEVARLRKELEEERADRTRQVTLRDAETEKWMAVAKDRLEQVERLREENARLNKLWDTLSVVLENSTVTMPKAVYDLLQAVSAT